MPAEKPIVVRGEGLSLSDAHDVACRRRPVQMSDESAVKKRIEASSAFVDEILQKGQTLYGVTTGVGANAAHKIPSEDVVEMQSNLIWFLKAGAGRRLPEPEVRAAMLLRLNSLMRGVSGIRWDLLRRIEIFLNEGVTPQMLEYGSIGASGDLVPLSYLAGSLLGIDPRFRVDWGNETLAAPEALARLGLAPLNPQAKEGLALVNGTSVMTGIGALCVMRTRSLLTLSLGTHALALQAVNGSVQAFAPFVQEHKPHPGQIRAAQAMTKLLADSRMTMEGMRGHFTPPAHSLIQDRYSLRCLPQYTAPLLEGLDQIARQIEIEMNSANDNPLLDAENKTIYNCGNFLGQYVGVGMDHLRGAIGLLAKHLDVQIALLVASEFNEGLAASLIGNTANRVNMGMKSLQIVGNSLMPLLTYLGAPLTDRYPTHAEHYNQNINSQGFGSANLARQSVEIFQTYMAVALMMGVQAVDLRAKIMAGHYDARQILSPASARLYEAVRSAAGRPPSPERPYIWDDRDVERDQEIARIAEDIRQEGQIPQSVADLLK